MSEASVISSDADLYEAYEAWKGWDCPFTFTADENDYFEAECRGLSIEGATLFEIGFGSGNFCAWAQAKGAIVVGSKINPASISAARAHAMELLPAAFETVAQDHSGRFDTCVAFDVFEHFTLAEITQRLVALSTMMKPGGHLLLRFPNAQSPFGLAPQNGDPTHKSALSRDVFELLVRKTSFEIVRYSGSFRIGGGGLMRSLARRLRILLRAIIATTLNFAYATKIPYDPVVVIVLRLRA